MSTVESWSCKLDKHERCDGEVVIDRDERGNPWLEHCSCHCHATPQAGEER